MASSQTWRRLAIFDEGFIMAGSGHDLARTPALDPIDGGAAAGPGARA